MCGLVYFQKGAASDHDAWGFVDVNKNQNKQTGEKG